MRIFLEKVMLDFPHVIDSDAVGQFDLRKGFPVGIVFAERVPGPRRFHFVEQASFHFGDTPFGATVGQIAG
jgi:hypothetical protein